jgi:tRNA-splicing endonuclease subunit Sen2
VNIVKPTDGLSFSCVVIPAYMDAKDRDVSPYGREDWYEERLGWKWMNTIMRVNSLVMKVSRCCRLRLIWLNAHGADCHIGLCHYSVSRFDPGFIQATRW